MLGSHPTNEDLFRPQAPRAAGPFDISSSALPSRTNIGTSAVKVVVASCFLDERSIHILHASPVSTKEHSCSITERNSGLKWTKNLMRALALGP